MKKPPKSMIARPEVRKWRFDAAWKEVETKIAAFRKGKAELLTAIANLEKSELTYSIEPDIFRTEDVNLLGQEKAAPKRPNKKKKKKTASPQAAAFQQAVPAASNVKFKAPHKKRIKEVAA